MTVIKPIKTIFLLQLAGHENYINFKYCLATFFSSLLLLTIVFACLLFRVRLLFVVNVLALERLVKLFMVVASVCVCRSTVKIPNLCVPNVINMLCLFISIDQKYFVCV